VHTGPHWERSPTWAPVPEERQAWTCRGRIVEQLSWASVYDSSTHGWLAVQLSSTLRLRPPTIPSTTRLRGPLPQRHLLGAYRAPLAAYWEGMKPAGRAGVGRGEGPRLACCPSRSAWKWRGTSVDDMPNKWGLGCGRGVELAFGTVHTEGQRKRRGTGLLSVEHLWRVWLAPVPDIIGAKCRRRTRGTRRRAGALSWGAGCQQGRGWSGRHAAPDRGQGAMVGQLTRRGHAHDEGERQRRLGDLLNQIQNVA